MKKFVILVLAICFAAFSYAQIITTFAGTGVSGSLGDGGSCSVAQLNVPHGLAMDAVGNMFIADYGSKKIRKIDTSGIITTICGTGVSGHAGDGGPAISAEIRNPLAIATDVIGNIYFSEAGYLRKIDTAGIISTIAGDGNVTYFGDGIPATAAQVGEIIGIAVDTFGNIFVTEFYFQRIRKINTAGIITTIAGTGTQSFSGDGGSALSATMSLPFGIALDASGNIYFSDKANNRVRKIDGSGTITTFAGTGSLVFSGEGGPAVAAGVPEPVGLYWEAGELYIAENLGRRVCKVDASGNITTVAGSGANASSGDGSFSVNAGVIPCAVVKDAAGSLYISDIFNSRIRKVTNCLSPISVSISGSTSICGGNSSPFVASGATSYIWSSNAGSATTSTVNLSPAMSTVYSVEGIAGGCIDADTILLTVYPVLSISGATTVCINNPQTLLTASGGTSYVWSANAGAATTDTTTVTVSTGTTYTVTGTAAGCTSIDTVHVTVSAPTIIFGTTDSVTYCNWGGPLLYATGDGISFLWSPGGSTNQAINVATSDTGSTLYSVTGIDAIGCVTSDSVVVTIIDCPPPVGVEEAVVSEELSIYPNPSNGLFTVETKAAQEQIEVFDYLGKLVFSKIKPQQGVLDLTTLNNGMYMIRLSTSTKVLTKKIIIQK